MNSRDRVLAAFAHEEPDRVPAWCGASTGFWEDARRRLDLDDEGLRKRFGDDFRRVFARHPPPDRELPPEANSVTPFGILRAGFEYGQPLNHPLANARLKDVHEYAWPDSAAVDVSHVCDEAAAYGGQYAILGGDWSPFWHDLIELFGMENMYYKMYDDPELIHAVLRHVVDFYAEVSQRMFDAAAGSIDIFFIGNDFGSQQGPLLSEEMFRRFILPHLARLVDLGHAYGMKVMLHCCGGFAELIPAMIEIGLDGLHALQPCRANMAPSHLKERFGDKILLNGAIDSHHVLMECAAEEVRIKTREVVEVMMPGGGYVAGASHDWILPETPLENVLAMYDAIQQYGVYSGL